MLKDNAVRAGRIKVLEAAIGAEPGFVEMADCGSSVGGQSTRTQGGIPIVTIDEAVQSVGGTLFIVKVDIEGFESDLFSSNLGWLDRTTAMMIEPHDWMLPGKKSSHAFQSAMGTRGFDLYINAENLIYIKA